MTKSHLNFIFPVIALKLFNSIYWLISRPNDLMTKSHLNLISNLIWAWLYRTPFLSNLNCEKSILFCQRQETFVWCLCLNVVENLWAEVKWCDMFCWVVLSYTYFAPPPSPRNLNWWLVTQDFNTICQISLQSSWTWPYHCFIFFQFHNAGLCLFAVRYLLEKRKGIR